MEEKEREQKKKIEDIAESHGLIDFLLYLQSPWRIFWSNFLAGITRGFGIVIGMSVVLGLAIWIIAQMVHLPIIGEYFQKAQEFITVYVEQTNYTSEFNEINKNLVEIKEILK